MWRFLTSDVGTCFCHGDNYVAILLCPFIVDAFQNLFHSHSQTFAFWLNLMVALMGMFIVMKQEKLSL